MKRILLTLAAAMGAMSSWAITAPQAFADAPKGVFMLLEKNNRLDMIDYFKSNLTVPVKNSLEGSSRITAMNDRAMTIAMTPSTTYDLVVLPADKAEDEVIALIVTVSTPATDSRVTFYDPSWKQLDAAKIMPEPDLKEWLTPEGQKNRDLVESIVPFIMARYSYDPASGKLTATGDLKTFLSPDMYEMIAGYLRPSISYTWNGRKMVLDK